LSQRGTTEPGFDDPLFDEISGGEERIGGMWANMDAGSQAFVDGNYSLAIEQFRLATQNHPDDSRSWQSLGMSLNKTGDLAGAEDAYRRALALAENSAVIHHELAKLLIAKAGNDEAEKYLLRAIELDPKMLDVHITLARLLSNSGRMEAALERYQDAAALDPQSGDLAVSQAETLITLNRVDEALTLLKKTVEINPKDAGVRMAYGLVLADTGKVELATTELQQALDSAEDDTTKGRAQYALGRLHLRQGDSRAAITAFGKALQLNPEHKAAGLELARTFVRTRDYKQALGTYETYLRRWPDSDGARVEAAQSALMTGDGSKAYSLLAKAAERQSASSRLMGSYARLLVLTADPAMRNPQLALQLAERALQKSPSAQHAETLALCHAAAGSFALAIELQETVLAQSGQTVNANVRNRMEANLARYKNRGMGRLPFDTL
ncbi:MAG: tetratricopeptide repeat protein, partial [Pseudomonadota bacterium]